MRTSRDMLRQMILRILAMNLTMEYLEMFAELAESKAYSEMSYEQFGTRLKLDGHADCCGACCEGVLLRDVLRAVQHSPVAR